jgi:hypothetical protein
MKLGWSICKQCKTLVVNVDKDGNCNPPCRRILKIKTKNKKNILLFNETDIK